jgi:hypothetical protein
LDREGNYRQFEFPPDGQSLGEALEEVASTGDFLAIVQHSSPPQAAVDYL